MDQDKLLITSATPVVELLAGLAEEAAELAQAALKLRRVYTRTSPTPQAEDEAYEHLLEEVADVDVFLDMLSLNLNAIGKIARQKTARWAERIRRASHER